MNSKNDKTSETDKLLLNSEDKKDLRTSYKYIALLDPNMYKSFKNNKIKISGAVV